MRKYVDENQLSSLTAHIIIHIQSINQKVKAFLISENKENIYTAESNELGIITLNIDKEGKYSITFDNEYVIIDKTEIIIDSSKKLYYLIAKYNPPSVYTVVIDSNNSNPLTSCSYEDDAGVMTAGGTSWDTASIFNDIKPCVFKNGEVQYYLRKDDFTMKENGGASDIFGNDGNVMIEIPQFGYRIYKRTEIIEVMTADDGSTTLTSTADKIVVQITNDKNVYKNINFIHNVNISEEEYIVIDENGIEHIYYYIIDENNNKIIDKAGSFVTTQFYNVDLEGNLRDNMLPEYYVGDDMNIYDENYGLISIYHQDYDSEENITAIYYNIIPTYKRYAFEKINENGEIEAVDKIYLGAYLSTYDNSSTKSALRSVVTSTAISSAANGYKAVSGYFDTLKALAEASGYNLWNYQQVVMLQCLYLIKYKNLNSQTAFGVGYTGASSSAVRVVGATALNGMFYGTTDKTLSVKFAGLEDFYGHFYQWIDNIGCDKSWNIIYDSGALKGTTIETPFTADVSAVFAKTVLGNTEGGFLLNSSSASSSTTYWCDKQAIANGTYVENDDGTTTGTLYRVAHGGSSNSSTSAGVFCKTVKTQATSYAARLMYM